MRIRFYFRPEEPQCSAVSPNRTDQIPQSRRSARKTFILMACNIWKLLQETWHDKKNGRQTLPGIHRAKDVNMRGNIQLTPIMMCSEKVSIAASIPLKRNRKGFALDETKHFSRQVRKKIQSIELWLAFS